MTDLKEVSNDPNYEAEAAGQSEFGIFYFFITYLYMQFLTDMSSGFIGGLLFLGVGMFVVSIALMFPLMMIRKKFDFNHGMTIVDFVVVVLCTRWAFIKLFG
tara:strand:- start:458 stop:763 length:306 start_codon:yes stop_codon:yes gene_type:complete